MGDTIGPFLRVEGVVPFYTGSIPIHGEVLFSMGSVPLHGERPRIRVSGQCLLEIIRSITPRGVPVRRLICFTVAPFSFRKMMCLFRSESGNS